MAGYVVGAEAFRDFARDLKQAGQGGVLREMAGSMRKEARPLKEEMQGTVRRLSSRGSRGGAAARAQRAAYLMRRRRKVINEKARLRAHRSSGLRAAAARTTEFQVRAGKRDASVRLRSNSQRMPPGQRKLAAYMNRGRWGHPTFGRPNSTVVQYVTPIEWFDFPARVHGPDVRDKVINTLSRYIMKSFG